MMIAAAKPTGTEIATTPNPMMKEFQRPSIIWRSFQSLGNQPSVKPSKGRAVG